MTLAASMCRGLATGGRRCRTPAPVAAWPLVKRGLDASSSSSSSSKHTAVGPSSTRGCATAVVVATPPAVAAAAAARGRVLPAGLPPVYRPDAGNSNGGRVRFSTTAGADAATEDTSGPPPAEAGKGEGAGGGSGVQAGDGETASPVEENPLEGMAEDDGDPGPPPPLDPSIVTEPSPKVLEVMASIESLNFVEMAMLIDVFKNKLGLEELPTLSFGGADGGGESGGGDGDAPAAAADKTIFKVKVTGFGDKAKIKVIKEVRVITGLGLREAKEMVESLPQVVKEDLKEDEAEAMKAKLESVGATVELE
ncbi:unnamed protein product [Ectocarpus fasciculatus]